jgi:transcriptional regulator with XRE-family HTH domain
MNGLGAVLAVSVRNHRARRGWRQREFSDRTGWSVGMVSDIETGHRRIGVDDLPVLCRVFDVSLAELLAPAAPEDLEVLKIHPS